MPSVQSCWLRSNSFCRKVASGGAVPDFPDDLSKLKLLLMKTILAPAFSTLDNLRLYLGIGAKTFAPSLDAIQDRLTTAALCARPWLRVSATTSPPTCWRHECWSRFETPKSHLHWEQWSPRVHHLKAICHYKIVRFLMSDMMWHVQQSYCSDLQSVRRTLTTEHGLPRHLSDLDHPPPPQQHSHNTASCVVSCRVCAVYRVVANYRNFIWFTTSKLKNWAITPTKSAQRASQIKDFHQLLL